MILWWNLTSIITSGTLFGTRFTGSLSYDSTGMTGVGVEYLGLKTITFSFAGVAWSKMQLYQGGEVVLRDGYPWYWTGAFLPPQGSLVTVLAIGFGGSGVIGYETPGGVFGMGDCHMVPTLWSYLWLLVWRIFHK